jgi:heme oxygenase
MPDLGEILRTETVALAERLKTLPFIAALRASELPPTALISFLRSLLIIHAVHERCLSSHVSGAIAAVGRYPLPKVPLLTADLEALGAESTPSVSGAIRGALDFGAEILTGADHAFTLVGVLYVLEELQNDWISLRRACARCLSVPEHQVSYIGCYGDATASHWSGFVACLNAPPLNDPEASEVVQGVTRCTERIGNLCDKLYPYSHRDLKHHVVAINFEAGDHAMPQNPLDIDLALRVGRTVWARYPYLEYRFGERGKRFASSDTCWLMALTEMSEESATENLHWLRTILASRGIPTVTLEDKLVAISRELQLRSPEQPLPCAHYHRFLSTCATERRALLDVENETRLIGMFDQRLRVVPGPTVESAAKLLTSAWVDERSGVAGALAAVRDWFVDPDRFSSGWIATVNELLIKLDQVAEPVC